MTDSQNAGINPRRSISRRAVRATVATVLCLIVLSTLLILLNAVLFRVFGGVEAWQTWRIDHYWHLLAWRLTLYTGLAVAWFKLKSRLPGQEAKEKYKRLRRIEVLVVLLVLLIELSKLVFQPGGGL
ncbi:hypothetical protein [Pseudomonas chlororaphis]|uniref:hypothetical protein n=1 Tax=Pseudomonas chlororaphis TaxID=587753 RepID=UPI00131FE8E1|nr:hypothetical protein [Pseudomonas chlororaphis]QHC91398.1 hypothetical protein PchlR47_24900 [Pseudomonas chlororaphis]